MCGTPRGPMVAHCMTICSARNARTSSSVIWIWSRRDGMRAAGYPPPLCLTVQLGVRVGRRAQLRVVRRNTARVGAARLLGVSGNSVPGGARQALGGLEHGLAGVLRLQHHRVARLLEDLARQPVGARRTAARRSPRRPPAPRPRAAPRAPSARARARPRRARCASRPPRPCVGQPCTSGSIARARLEAPRRARSPRGSGRAGTSAVSSRSRSQRVDVPALAGRSPACRARSCASVNSSSFSL